MTTKPRVLSDAELVQACRDKAALGSSFVDSNLAAERREVTEYYLGKRPYPLREGGSKFVSQDVYLSVESMKAELVETFGAGSNIVAFAPQGPQDLPLAKVSTAFAEFVVHRQNPGLLLFQDVVHDALTNRVGIAKVFWDKDEVTEEYQFNHLPEQELLDLLGQPNVHLTSQPQGIPGPQGIVYSGEYEAVTDTSQVRIVAIPPEEFIITGRSTSLDDKSYKAHRYRSTLGELVDDGYDHDLVYSITGGDDDFAFDADKLERTQDTLIHYNDDDASDEAGRMVTVHESYIWIDALGIGRQQQWKIVHVGETILDKQRVSDHPFVAFVPQPIPHTFFGNNFAQRTIQHANTKTTLTRAIIEQAVDATNPRWQIARGGVANPRELLDNRRGGIVNVRSVSDSIAPLPTGNINPFVLQTISHVDSDREDTTGISRLSQGLDKNALSQQNSAGLVEQLTNNSQTRTKVIARNFALQFVSQLYLKVYKLVCENETREHIIQVAGNFVPCLPSAWAARRDVHVDMTLGYNERDKRVEELLTVDKALSEANTRMYGEQQKFNLWRDAFDIKGIKNVQDYLADPSQMGPQEPDPLKVAEVENLKKKTEVEERQMALRERQVQSDAARKDADAKQKIDAARHKAQIDALEQGRRERETTNKIDVSQAELELAIHTQITAPPENQKLTAIASPNS